MWVEARGSRRSDPGLFILVFPPESLRKVSCCNVLFDFLPVEPNYPQTVREWKTFWLPSWSCNFSQAGTLSLPACCIFIFILTFAGATTGSSLPFESRLPSSSVLRMLTPITLKKTKPSVSFGVSFGGCQQLYPIVETLMKIPFDVLDTWTLSVGYFLYPPPFASSMLILREIGRNLFEIPHSSLCFKRTNEQNYFFLVFLLHQLMTQHEMHGPSLRSHLPLQKRPGVI